MGPVARQGDLTEKRPVEFLGSARVREYDFWANVDPDVPHPRWRQGPLGSDERPPTLIWNGYGEQVAQLYDSRKGERLFT